MNCNRKGKRFWKKGDINFGNDFQVLETSLFFKLTKSFWQKKKERIKWQMHIFSYYGFNCKFCSLFLVSKSNDKIVYADWSVQYCRIVFFNGKFVSFDIMLCCG